MTSKVNQRAKRKNNFCDSKIEPNLKALKKEDIIAQFNTLQAKFDLLEKKNIVLEKKNLSLEKEKNTHIEAIHILEETVKILDNQSNLSKLEKDTKEIQTDTVEPKGVNTDVYICGDCEYIADCVHDFNDHTHNIDGLEDADNLIFNCNFCTESFETLQEVMMHNKANHYGSVQHCKQFLNDICYFGNNCWFLHIETLRNSEPSFT